MILLEAFRRAARATTSSAEAEGLVDMEDETNIVRKVVRLDEENVLCT